MAYETKSKLTTVLNFRDLGCSVPNVRPGLLFRSGHIDDASPEDCLTLREVYCIRSVIDLRGPWPPRWIYGGKKRKNVERSPDDMEYDNILGLQRLCVDLVGVQFEAYQLPIKNPWQYARKRIIQKMSQDRWAMTADMIHCSGLQIKAIFKVLATPSAYPIQILDRWGTKMTALVVCLVLFLLGVDSQSIMQDYLLSDQELVDTQEERAKIYREFGLPEEWSQCMPNYVYMLEEYLNRDYGGIEKYLLSIGLTKDDLQTIKSTLRYEKGTSEKQSSLSDVSA